MSSELRVDKIIPVDGVPSGGGGGVIQIVDVGTTTEQTITSSTPTTVLTASITPKFSTSKIRIELNIFAYHMNYYDGYVGLFRGSSSSVITGTSQGSYSDQSSIMLRQGSFEDQTGNGDYQCNPSYYSYLDTANTTSQISYVAKAFSNGGSSYPTYINRSHSRGQSNSNFPKLRSTLTLTEYSA
tara:strand:- start:275 stop:826 length:552 start_codon:yes stop_codon:yes gene_type:complete